MSLLAVLAVIWAVCLVYVLWIHVRAAAERAARRSTRVVRIAVRAWPPSETPAGTWAGDAHIVWRYVAGLFTDRPRGVPLIAAIVAGGGTLFVFGDLLMDEPLLWPASIGPQLPDAVRFGLLALLVVAPIANCVWIFFAARLTLSWDKLVLRPDGVIALDGLAEMPPIDASRTTLVAMSIPSAHGTPAPGVTLEQNGLRYAFDYFGLPGHDQWLHVTPAVPHDWWHIELSGEAYRVDAFLEAHCGPGSAPFARFTPGPDDDS